MTESHVGCAETPLSDLLRKVPKDAVLSWEVPEEGRAVWQLGSESSPVGLLMHRAADRLDGLAPTREADTGREAIRKVIHELWQLLDDGETGADGTVTIDQARYQEVSKAMDELEALVPDSAGPFWGGFPVNYFWDIRPSPVVETAGQAAPLKTDDGGCVTKRFVIFNRPGMAPEKKGGWLKDEHLIDFLREVMIHDGWTPGFRATVLELTWDNDLWASSASEYLSTHDHAIGQRRARKAWQEARDKHERIYKSAPSMPLGQEIAAYHRLTAPPIATQDDDRVEIASEALAVADQHIQHMAAWISRTNASDTPLHGYSFEALGEDKWIIDKAVAALKTTAAQAAS